LIEHIAERKPLLERNEYVILAVLLIITFMLRFYVLPAREVIEYDGVHWAMLGKNLFSGKGYTEPEGIFQWYYPPLYPINLGIFWLFLKNAELAGGMVSLVYGTLLPVLVYLLTRSLYGKKAAVTAAILIAFYPPLVDVSSAVLADSMFIFLSILSVLAGYYALNRFRSIPFFVLGSLISILYLTKSAGIQYVGIFLLWIIIYGIQEKKGGIQTLRMITFFLIGFMILSLPYFIYLKNHFGQWTASELSSISLYEGIKVDENDYPYKSYQLTADASEMAYWTSSSYTGRHIRLLDVFRKDPQEFLSRYFRNLKKLSSFLFIPVKPFRILLLLLLCFGLLRALWIKKEFRKEIFLFSMLLPMFVFPMITARTIRYLFPLMPILIILCARGIVEFHEWSLSVFQKIVRGKKYKLYRALISTLILSIIAIGTAAEAGYYLVNLEKGRKGYDPVEHKELGLWIRDNLGPDVMIMSTSPHIAFYAECKHATLPWGELPEVLKYAHKKGVEYLAVGERYVPSQRPLVAFLLDEKKAPGQLKLIYKLTGMNRKKILLYKLIGDSG
jgi:4-amino-4-deoxy-L-arabinose transferase-like glycosyltransferase